MQTQTNFEQLYKQVQNELERLRQENQKVKTENKRLAIDNKRYHEKSETFRSESARYKDEAAYCQTFLHLIDTAFCVSSRFLTHFEKIVFYAIANQVMLSDNEKRGIYTKVLAMTIIQYFGKAARLQSTLERLMQMRLIIQMPGEHLDGELWLAIPPDILDRLANIPKEFEHKGNYTRYCKNCRRNVIPRYVNTTFEVCECSECGNNLDNNKAYETTMLLGEMIAQRDLTDVEASYLQEAYLKIRRERQNEQTYTPLDDTQPPDEQPPLVVTPAVQANRPPLECPYCGGTSFHKDGQTLFCTNVTCSFSIEQE